MKSNTNAQIGEAATLLVGRTGSKFLDLEDEVMNVAAVLDLIGQRLATQLEEHSEGQGDRSGGLITLIHRTQRNLRSAYDAALQEWQGLRLNPSNN